MKTYLRFLSDVLHLEFLHFEKKIYWECFQQHVDLVVSVLIYTATFTILSSLFSPSLACVMTSVNTSPLAQVPEASWEGAALNWSYDHLSALCPQSAHKIQCLALGSTLQVVAHKYKRVPESLKYSGRFYSLLSFWSASLSKTPFHTLSYLGKWRTLSLPSPVGLKWLQAVWQGSTRMPTI